MNVIFDCWSYIDLWWCKCRRQYGRNSWRLGGIRLKEKWRYARWRRSIVSSNMLRYDLAFDDLEHIPIFPSGEHLLRVQCLEGSLFIHSSTRYVLFACISNDLPDPQLLHTSYPIMQWQNYLAVMWIWNGPKRDFGNELWMPVGMKSQMFWLFLLPSKFWIWCMQNCMGKIKYEVSFGLCDQSR